MKKLKIIIPLILLILAGIVTFYVKENYTKYTINDYTSNQSYKKVNRNLNYKDNTQMLSFLHKILGYIVRNHKMCESEYGVIYVVHSKVSVYFTEDSVYIRDSIGDAKVKDIPKGIEYDIDLPVEQITDLESMVTALSPIIEKDDYELNKIDDNTFNLTSKHKDGETYTSIFYYKDEKLLTIDKIDPNYNPVEDGD